jgi:hypothetical protein
MHTHLCIACAQMNLCSFVQSVLILIVNLCGMKSCVPEIIQEDDGPRVNGKSTRKHLKKEYNCEQKLPSRK